MVRISSRTPPEQRETLPQVYVVRHGETDWNREGRFGGRTDIPLNRVGTAQAAALGRRLGPECTAVYSSPLRRAVQTAETIAAVGGLPVQCLDGLMDMAYGEWDGRTMAEMTEHSPDLARRWSTRPHDTELPGGETLEQVHQRSWEVFQGVVKDLKEADSVVMVSHNAVCRAIVMGVLGIPLQNFRRVAQQNGAINQLDVRGGIIRLLSVNDRCGVRQAHVA